MILIAFYSVLNSDQALVFNANRLIAEAELQRIKLHRAFMLLIIVPTLFMLGRWRMKKAQTLSNSLHESELHRGHPETEMTEKKRER